MIRRIALASALALVTAPAFAATYTLDPGHTQVVFSWNHFGYSNPTAQFRKIEGTLEFDAANPTKANVKVTIPLNSVNTNVEKLDEHLQAADFFDSAKYPDAVFKSTKVEKGTSENQLKVTGDLSLHGVTKPVVLDVTVAKVGEHPMRKAPAAGFDAVGLPGELHAEAVAEHDTVLAVLVLAVPFLVDQPTVLLVGLLVTVVGLALLLQRGPAGHRHQALGRAHVGDLEAQRAARGIVRVGRVGGRHLHAHRAVLLGREVGARQAGEGRRHEWLQHVRRERLDLVATAHRGADDRAHRLALRIGIAGLLRSFHLLAGRFHLLAERVELAERAVLVDRDVAVAAADMQVRACCTHAHHRAGADDAADDQRADPAQHDRDDHADRGVASGLVGRRLHRVRQAEIEQVDAVDAARDRDQPAKAWHDLADAGDPARGPRIGDGLQRLHRILLAAEVRRERVDDERHHVGHREAERIADDRAGNAGADADAIAEAERAVSDQAALDEAGDRRDCGEDHDPVLVQVRHGRRLGRNDRPLGLRCQQDRLGARNQLVDIHVFPPVADRWVKQIIGILGQSFARAQRVCHGGRVRHVTPEMCTGWHGLCW